MAPVGYRRVIGLHQDLSLQIEQLERYGCEKIFTEKESDRGELQKALDYLRAGDKLVVYKIDRLARSTFDLHKIAEELTEKGIGMVFIKEDIDFSTPSDKLMFTMLGAISEFERDLINERTAEDRERARQQGKHLGQKGKPEKDVKQALKLFAERETNGLSVNDIAKITGMWRSTIYARVKSV